MTETTNQKLERLKALREEVAQLEAEVWEEEEQEEYRKRELPTAPGWYVDSENNPARLSDDGHWDDGWGNGGQGYGYPNPPLRRLTPEGERP